MSDQNKYVNPILLRMMRRQGQVLGQPTNTIGAGVMDKDMFRNLGVMAPRLPGGGSIKVNNPAANAKTFSFIPENYTKEDVKRYLDYLDVPYREKEAKTGGSVYIKYRSPGDAHQDRPKYGTPTIRFTDPDDPHVGKPKNTMETINLLDTVGKHAVPGKSQQIVMNANREGYDNPEALMRAILWRTTRKLVPEGSEPSIVAQKSQPKSIPIEQILPDPNQFNMLKSMTREDISQRAPTVAGGNKDNPFSSHQMANRYNLITPQDLGNFGSREYDPMKDPNYAALLNLVMKRNLPQGNDR